MGQTRLSRWLLQRQALVMLLASVLVLAVCAMVVGQGFAWIERDRVNELLHRSAGMLRSGGQHLLSSNRDYAAWDDTYRFMTVGDSGFVDANFSAGAMANLGVDWVAFVRADGSLAEGRYTVGEQAGKPLDPAVVGALQAALPLRGGPQAGAAGKDLAWIGARPMLLTWSAISNSAETAQAGSWLAFGRDLSDTGPGRGDWQLGLPFAIQPLSPGAHLPAQAQWDGKAWAGRLSLMPWPAALSLRLPPAYDGQRNAVLGWLFAGIGVLVLLAMAALALLFRHKVLRRLENFAALAHSSAEGVAVETRWPVSGTDELDVLAGALNGMMERIEQQEADLAYLASHDPLTGLGNRRQLMSALRAAVATRLRSGDTDACLMLVDLDRFKSINDSLGHAAGDVVLSVVADRILSTIRQGDLVVRLGGDEFALLLSGIRAEQVAGLCDRLLARLAHAIPHEQRLLFTTASIGIAWVEAGLSEHELLRRADHAMYRAKQGGRNRAESFQAALDD